MVIFNKMKITAVIAEFNPFHKGHKYILDKAREDTGADYVIVLMSGNFVQRGEPAVFDMGVRINAALRNGSDAVFELPPQFALSSAEGFASGAVSILNKLCIDHIVFGSETGDMAALDRVSSVLSEESPEYRSVLKDRLKSGDPFPAAREAAVKACISDELGPDSEILKKILREPNNILALEYLKALKRSDSSIIPVAAERIGSGYHAGDSYDSSYSAEGIRNRIFRKKSAAVHRDSLTPLLLYKLLSPGLNEALRISLVPRDLQKRIINYKDQILSFSEFCSLLKTRNITYTAVSRHLIHLILDMDYLSSGLSEMIRNIDYLRLLGFRTASRGLFSELKKRGHKIDILGNSTDINNYLKNTKDGSRDGIRKVGFLETHLRIDQSYNILKSDNIKREQSLIPEIIRQPVIL